MRRSLTNILVILFMITSLKAASWPTHPHVKSSPANTPVTHHRKPKPYQVGRASWYGRFFHGKETASGEPYNMFHFTAAHRRLPLGTILKVTNLENGKTVVVRVNDRGPVPRSRIIDLSYEAATAIGLRRPGVQWVRLDILDMPSEVAFYQGSTP